jgi:LPPG:FO 2-phospho-L-lactate transferase
VRICVIAGGVGSARFLTGLLRVVDPADVTVVVNTGDDERIRGLHVSPDVDTVLYHLANATDWERGWGLDRETFVANERYNELVERAELSDIDMQEWFGLGDRDLATHMLRTRMLDAGRSLTDATDALRRGLGIACRVLPMSDDPVRTALITRDHERLDFQEYFVQRGHRDEIESVDYVGANHASPAPGVLEALEAADLLIVPPSNPVLSVAPILELAQIRKIFSQTKTTRVAVSPIVGGKALKGPADRVLAAMGYEVSSAGVHEFYAGLLDVLFVDEADRDLDRPAAPPEWLVTDTIMSDPASAAELAKKVVAVAR